MDHTQKTLTPENVNNKPKAQVRCACVRILRSSQDFLSPDLPMLHHPQNCELVNTTSTTKLCYMTTKKCKIIWVGLS
jgi:hypothetical protein